eukprot:TRINITY_DN15878_c0_g1_i1.p1 TRINITY_DN15878_c0_g1~~TRINITY_DN15878_c0_g1_i1.p1  ORF type:complete len:100 (+),score=4.31 TRINITY_DN15878_c0_g1_i1:1-300(+)
MMISILEMTAGGIPRLQFVQFGLDEDLVTKPHHDFHQYLQVVISHMSFSYVQRRHFSDEERSSCLLIGGIGGVAKKLRQKLSRTIMRLDASRAVKSLEQ